MATLYRLLRNLIITCAVVGLLLFFFIFFFQLDGIEYYTMEDKALYDDLTDEIVKDAPRISTVYQFVHAPPEGPGSEVSAVHFEDTTDIASLRNYLISIGCTREKVEQGWEEWLSKDSTKRIVLSVDQERKMVGMQVVLLRTL
ncbi:MULTISPECIES: hypothetical protein [Pectobacterium]|uniref:hypothetical protein n=1 Tax=Pectobacterium TaxID=122277 RepID=UPI00027E0F7D|nr:MULTISPECIES: hypothetical protein [Pectobacterium]AFR02936.1 hypothetical protein PCC21_015330 [Pectobacterium carotovorum subsp. carotovorum PCC21]UPY93692.1 hypothetical protein MYB54_13905 [Pectobacterium sp. 21LCBS03]GKV98290.1 hypothetical protein PEC301653_13360 [Pectobacterium carotovorum subsp. carotovorum]